MSEEIKSKPPTDWTNWFTLPRFLLLVAFLLIAEFPEVIFGSSSFFYRDFGLFSYPTAYYARESLWRGEIPLWNPLNSCGIPFLAQWNTGVCYPLSIVWLLFPMPWSVNFFCILHLFLAGAAMWLLAWRWTENRFAASVAGLAFASSGVMMNNVMFFSHLAALAWMPLVILRLEEAWSQGGRAVVIAALVAATQMLAGSPEITLFTWLLAASLWAGQIFWNPMRAADKPLLRFCDVALLVTGMCAFQLLPFFQLLQHSSRSSATDGGGWAMPLWGWANLLLPLFGCTPSLLGVFSQDAQQWTSSYYLGAGVLTLALAAVMVREPRARWLVLVSAVGLVLALGDAGYIWLWLKKALPILGFARYLVKFVVLPAFAVPLLAAYVINNADQPKAKNFQLLRRSLWVVGCLSLAGLIGLMVYSQANPEQPELVGKVFWNGLVRAILLVMVVGAVLVLARVAVTRIRILLGIIILLAVGVDLLTHMPRQNPVVSSRVFQTDPPLAMSPVPAAGKSRAMVSHFAQAWLNNSSTPDPTAYYTGLRQALFRNCNLLVGVPKVDGFFTLYPADYEAVRQLLYDPSGFSPGLADFVGVEQITAPGEMFRWSARKTALPLVTGGQLPVFLSQSNALAALASPAFDPRRVVYLPEDLRGEVPATNATSVEISKVDFTAHHVNVHARAADAAWVVIAQSAYPCWQAYVDDQPATVVRANAAFQAVGIPAGEHEVRLVYEDRWFSWGVCLSLAAWLYCLWRALRWRQKKIEPVKPYRAAPEKADFTLPSA